MRKPIALSSLFLLCSALAAQNGSFTTFGKGCASTTTLPTVSSSTVPMIGMPFTLNIQGFLARPQLGQLMLGVSNSSWGSIPLPLDLTLLGMRGCTLLVSPDLTSFFILDWQGQSKIATTIPSDPTLFGAQIYGQTWAPDAAANPLGAATTNGFAARIGGTSSLSYDGKASYVRVPDATDLRLGMSSSTVEAWVWRDGKTAGGHEGICVKRDSNTTNKGWFFFSSGSFGPREDYPSFCVEGGPDPQVSGSAKIPYGQWVHVAATRSGGTCTIWLNGKSVRTGKVNIPNSKDISDLFIGRDSERPSYHWKGLLDEIRISSVARYTAPFTPQYYFQPDSNTIALWHFDERTGSVAKDSSGNGHHGVITNATWDPNGR